MIHDRWPEDEADFMDALYDVEHIGLGNDDEVELNSIFAGAGLGGDTHVDAALHNPCMIAAGFVMCKQDESSDDYEGY